MEYGRLHTVVHRHAMTDAPLVGDFMKWGPRIACGEDALNKYEFKLKEEVNYDVFSGPSMRIGIDFADVGNAESILPTGQSGNVFSPHYDDQAAMYHAANSESSAWTATTSRRTCRPRPCFVPRTDSSRRSSAWRSNIRTMLAHVAAPSSSSRLWTFSHTSWLLWCRSK